MLDSLKFAMGAISRKGLLPALTHFRIQEGTVRSFNGTLALCAPIALDIDCVPKAEPLYRAIQNCEETVALQLTPSGKLSVRSGSFRAIIDCVTEETPHALPEGEEIKIDGELLLQALRAVEPFIGDDASRPWSNGVLLSGPSAFATNNITLVQYWLGAPFPRQVNVPELAVREILRIGEPPLSAQLSNHSITFHYGSGKWIRSQLLDTRWPELEPILGVETVQKPVPEGFFTALRKLKPFVDGIGCVYLDVGQLRTHLEESEGAAIELPGIETAGLFNIEMLLKLEGIVDTIDFNLFPKPCMFRGDRLRGAIIGLRMPVHGAGPSGSNQTSTSTTN